MSANGSVTLEPQVLQIENYDDIAAGSTYYDYGCSCPIVNGDGEIILPATRGATHGGTDNYMIQYRRTAAGVWSVETVATFSGVGLLNPGGGIDSAGNIYLSYRHWGTNSASTDRCPVLKSTNGGDSYTEIVSNMGFPSGQAVISPYGPIVEWPDTGSGRRLMQSCYSFETTGATGDFVTYVTFCDPDTDDTDWSEVVEIHRSSTVKLTETAICRISDTEAIAVARNNAGVMYQHKTTDRGQT